MPPLTAREQAEELRLALAMGLIEKAEVIRWADSLIELQATPADWILDVSLSANESPDAIAARLKDAADHIDVTVATQSALERFASAFRSGKLAPLDAAQRLAMWATSSRVDDGARGKAFQAKFLAEDVAEGWYGSADDVTREIERFLAWRLR